MKSAVLPLLFSLVLTRLVAVILHEGAHALTALAFGYSSRISVSFLGYSSTTAQGISQQPRAAAIVRHSGWILSVAIAAIAGQLHTVSAASCAVLWLTAFDAIYTDLLVGASSPADDFRCGNFGLLLLDKLAKPLVRKMLETSVRVTMMRGAQSAGLVTYVKQGDRSVGKRRRVVNGKRTDLCDLLMTKCGSQLQAEALCAPQLFQGHTRFATSSIASLPGCHPHQWSPAAERELWTADSNGSWTCRKVSHETFVTHNGDLDFFEWHGIVYALSDVFTILEAVLHKKPPATVDSQGVAGLLELLRTRGNWFLSVRYGYVHGALQKAGNLTRGDVLPHLWSPVTLATITAEFERYWLEVLSSTSPRAAILERMLAALPELDLNLPPTTDGDLSAGMRLVEYAVDSFFDMDLYAAARELLRGAEGSFGLCLSTSIDATNEIVIAARGQTMSIAFWPRLGVVTWGSEAAATKTGLGQTMCAERTGAAADDLLDGFRFDLDDVNGETVWLRWDEEACSQDLEAAAPPLPATGRPETVVMRYGHGLSGVVRVSHVIDGRNGSVMPFLKRTMRMGGNPYVAPLPPLGIKNAVGADIQAIPEVCKQIIDDWNEPSTSLNRLTAFTLLVNLRKRLLLHANGAHDGAVDVLITGCEVSLWCGEQFASDLHNAFPQLRVVTLSANKLLAQLGQAFPMPSTGFYFNEKSYRFTSDTNVLLLSHSGGTFATLNVSNLLKGYTSNLFVVTSEWDTQIARSVRAGVPGRCGNARGFHSSLHSYVFTTFCGCRPAEPVSLTVVATHQLLTQILLYVMYSVRFHHPKYPELGGSSFTLQEVRELEGLNTDGIADLEAIVTQDSAVRRQLLEQGRAWSRHILEGPITWIMSAVYVVATVVSGLTPLSAIVFALTEDDGPLGECTYTQVSASSGAADAAAALGAGSTPVFVLVEECASTSAGLGVGYAVAVLDAAIYVFLPIWTAFLLRAVQGRPILHRVSGRSLLIGDVPWVAQTLEAFVSKTFSLAYSIATISVSSANPIDHLVHRHTHRVVRGSLLAVGRPDGRLNALTASENTACLAVNQASSIQNFGVTCESITLGHNRFKLPLTAAAIHLPQLRMRFMSEHYLGLHKNRGLPAEEPIPDAEAASKATTNSSRTRSQRRASVSGSASSLMGIFSTLDMKAEGNMEAASMARRSRFDRIPKMWGEGSAEQESFIGEWMLSSTQFKGFSSAELIKKQRQLQELFEGRIASMHRLVGFFVLFHEMAKRVQDFWPAVSFGLLGYDMGRSQSIMRIATTASPVSGSDVRHKMVALGAQTAREHVASVITKKWISARLHGIRARTHNGKQELTHEQIQAQIDRLRKLDRQSLEKRSRVFAPAELASETSVPGLGAWLGKEM